MRFMKSHGIVNLVPLTFIPRNLFLRLKKQKAKNLTVCKHFKSSVLHRRQCTPAKHK